MVFAFFKTSYFCLISIKSKSRANHFLNIKGIIIIDLQTLFKQVMEF